MKQLKIKCGKKQVIVTKDLLTIATGIVILVVDSLLAGFLQLFEFGFDWTYITKSEFWTAYCIKLAISYIALFGAYIIRRVINKKSPKFIAQREKIKDSKNAIVKARKISNCKNWLKFVYNYTKKVEIYQDIITSKYEKIIFKEPEQPDTDYLDENKFFDKLKIARLNRNYKIAKAKYEKSEKLRKFYEAQLKVCDKHFEIIDAYKHHDMEKVKKLQEEIKENDFMKHYNLHYKNVTYNKLFNVDLSSTRKDDRIEYNEAGILAKKIMPSLLMGVVGCAVVTSVVVQTGSFSATTIFMIALNLLMMAWFMFSGIRIADSFIFGVVFAADNNRIIICEEFIEDSALLGDNWTQTIDVSYEPEVVENEEQTDNKQEENVTPIEDIHIPIVRRPKI